MKTVFTAPKVSSIADNEINDLFSISYYLPQLRLLYLEGIPVRIELNKERYVELSSYEEEIEIDNYDKVFKKLFDFFYGTGYLYGFVKNKKLKIYDVFTNENFLSSKDLMILETNYGLPIAKPIFEGNFTTSLLIEILNKKVNNEGLKSDFFHILPSVYVNDTREGKKTSAPDITQKVILGEKKAATTTYTSPYTYPSSTTYSSPSTSSLNDVKKEKKMDAILYDVFSLTKKDERSAIYKETLKNLNDYANSLSNLTDVQKEWWKKYGIFFSYLYSIVMLPATRQLVYDYCLYYNLAQIYYASSIEVKWSHLFGDFFFDEFSGIIKTKKIDWIVPPYDMLALFFKDEFIEFDKFFVKETKKEEDWRYGENLFIGSLEGY